MNNNILLMLTIIIPLLGSVLILLFRKLPNIREFITIITAIILFIVNIILVKNVVTLSSSASITLVSFFPGGGVQLNPEPLGLIFGLIASGLWIVTSIYSI